MAYILNSPVFTGNPTAPTPLTADSSTSIATTAFVKAQGYGSGTVTAIGVTTANGVSGSSSGGSTPNLTITLGAITPTSVNGLTISSTVGTLTIANTAGASLVTSGGGYAINLAANGAASTVTMPASTSATMLYYTAAPAQYAIPYAGAASGLISYLGVNASGTPGFFSQVSSGAPTWVSSTGSGNVVLATSPSIATPTITGGATFSTGTSSVSSGATLNIPSGASLTIASGATFTSANTPVNPNDVANKAYVDANIQGLSPKPTASLATSGTLNATQVYTYNNGTAGVGATLTNAGTLAALVVDGITVTVGQVILVKNEITYPQYNGLYTVTTVGTGAVAWVLTRHVDMDSTTEFQGGFIPIGNTSTVMANGTQTVTVNTAARTIILSGSGTLNWTTLGAVVNAAFEMAGWTALTNNNQGGFIIQSITTTTATNDTITWTVGSIVNSPASGAQTGNISVYLTGVTNDNTLWLCESTGAITVGTTPVTFTQLNSATSLQAGTGISISGNVISTAAIPNASLTNSSVLLGGQTLTLGAAATTTLTGMVSISSTSFTGALTGNASTATSVSGGSTSQIVYQTAASTSGFITLQNYAVLITNSSGAPSLLTGAAGVLVGSASANPTWSTTPSLTGTNFSGTAASLTAGLATAVAGGTANQILYQSGAGVTAFATAGNYGVVTTGATGVPVVTAGAAGVLVGSASAIPSWSTSPSISGANITATTIPIASINATTTGSGTILTLATGPSISGATLTGTTTHTGGKIVTAIAVAGYASILITPAALNPTTQATGDLWVNGTTLYYYNGTSNIPLSNALVNPMTTLGDMVYGGASGASTRLAGLTTNGFYVLGATTASSLAGAPTWTTTTGNVGSSIVLATSPTLVTPVLGAATATSINSLTITTSVGTLTIANNAAAVITFAGSFAQTFTAGAASSVAMPQSTTAVMQYYNTGAPSIQYAFGYANAANSGLVTYIAPPTITGNYVLMSSPAGSAVAPVWSSAGTGTGTIPVFQTSPTLITPALGVATATSINGLAITTTTGGTLTLANSSSLITSGAYSITLTSTGATNITLPTSGYVMTNPMTTIGDLIYSSTTATPGAPARLASAAGVLYCTGAATAPTWSTSPTISGANISAGTIPWSALTTTAQPDIVNTVVNGTTALTTAYSFVLCNAASGAITLNLPAGPVTGTQFMIKKIDSSANTVTISGGSAYIDSTSVTTYVLSAQWNAIRLTYNSSNTTWYIS